MAAVLTQSGSNEVDTQARIGGEEFIILVPEADTEVMQRVASSIIEAMRKISFVSCSDALNPTCRVGYAVIGDEDATWVGLLARADAAMYRAKELGRDRVVAA